MTWNDTARKQYNHNSSRYQSDLTDEEWKIIEPSIPPAKPGGRKRSVNIREVVSTIWYISSSGCQWRMLSKDFPPASTVRYYFYQWRNSGLLSTINDILVMGARQLEGKSASPSACVIDSQSMKTTESGGICGYDAGKRSKVANVILLLILLA